MDSGALHCGAAQRKHGASFGGAAGALMLWLAPFVMLTVMATLAPLAVRAAGTAGNPGGAAGQQPAVAPAASASPVTPAAPVAPASLDGPAQLLAQQWAHLWNTESLEALVALYAKDGEFYPTSGERVAGQPALRALFAAALAGNKPAITMTSVSSARSGTIAFDAGEYVEIITRRANGAAFSVSGHYLLVCRQVAGGRWLISQQMWTESAQKAR